MAVKGRGKLLAKLAALPSKSKALIGEALRSGADEIVAAQKRLAPVRTGELRDSIVATSGNERIAYSQGVGGAGDPDLSVRISAGNKDVRYAHLVEFGAAPHKAGGMFEGADHPGARARLFFFPPYRALRKRVKSRVGRATKKAAREVAGS